MTFVSLFTGIEGIGLGLERAGMQCLAQVENNIRCQWVLTRHYPNVPRWKDISHVRGSDLPAVDLVCGGFPCQDLSVAGQRAGLAGKRSGLWFEFHRLLTEHRPRWVLIENVPGLLSSNEGRDFAIVLQGLVQLGYRVAWRVLDAQYLGVAQRRERVFIVGSLGSGRCAEVLFEPESVPGNPPPRRQAGTRVAATLAGGAHPGGFNGRDADNGNITLAHPLTTHNARHEPTSDTLIDDQRVTAFDWYASPSQSMNPGPMAPSLKTTMQPAVYQCHGSDVGPMGTLRQGNGGVSGGVPFVAGTLGAEMGRNRGLGQAQETDLIVPCATFDPRNVTSATNRTRAEFGLPANTLHEQPLSIIGGLAPRCLTPRECERLQGFPDDWTRWGVTAKGMLVELSDSARYRMTGNAVCAHVAEWIGRRIERTTS